MKRSKVASVIFIVALFLILSTEGIGLCQQKTYHWRIGFNTVEGSVRDVAAKEFRRIVSERTNGQVKVDIFPGEILGTEQEMIEAVMVGALDIQLSGGGSMQNLIPEFAASALPFVVHDFEEAYALLDGSWGDKLKALAEEHNLKILSFCDLGFAQITNSKRPIYTPDDLKGIKMRSPNEPVSIETFKALGAAVSTLPFSEVYLALAQKVVDGQFNPLDAIWDSKFYEVQDYLAIINVFYYNVNFMMNKALWDSLPGDLQNVVQEAAYAARDVSREFSQAKHTEMLEKLKPHFKEITYPDPRLFQQKIQPLYQDTFTNLLPKYAIDSVIRFMEDYRKNK